MATCRTLHVTSPGELVEKDQPLLTLYSPDLLTAERELVELLRMRDKARTPTSAAAPRSDSIDSAKRRLAQWNVTPAQIADLEHTRKPGEFLTLLSPFRGIVEAVPVDQGRNVQGGRPPGGCGGPLQRVGLGRRLRERTVAVPTRAESHADDGCLSRRGVRGHDQPAQSLP